jgi:hypothetical protein
VNLRAEHDNGTNDHSIMAFCVKMDVLKMYSFCCSLGVVTAGAIQNFVLQLIIDTPTKSASPDSSTQKLQIWL